MEEQLRSVTASEGFMPVHQLRPPAPRLGRCVSRQGHAAQLSSYPVCEPATRLASRPWQGAPASNGILGTAEIDDDDGNDQAGQGDQGDQGVERSGACADEGREYTGFPSVGT